MQRQVAEASAKPGEDVLLSFESDTEAFHGRLARARDLSNRAAASALGNESPETAAAWRMDMALRDAEFRNIALSRKEIAYCARYSQHARCEYSSGAGVRAYRRKRSRKALSGRPGWKDFRLTP